MTIRQVRINDVVHDIAVGLNSENSTNLIQTNTTPIEARENLGFTYGDVAPTEAPITGEGSVYFMNEASEIPLPIPEGGTGAVNAQGAIENLGMYPVGAQYVTSTNTNPGAWLGGTWELIDKQFADAVFGSECFVADASKMTGSPAVALHRNGHSIAGNFSWTTAVKIEDSTITIGHFDFSILGISEIGYECVINALSDGGGVVVMTRIVSASGNVNTVDCFGSDTSLAIGKYIYGYISFTVPKENILDSACDKFFWKRVA